MKWLVLRAGKDSGCPSLARVLLGSRSRYQAGTQARKTQADLLPFTGCWSPALLTWQQYLWLGLCELCEEKYQSQPFTAGFTPNVPTPTIWTEGTASMLVHPQRWLMTEPLGPFEKCLFKVFWWSKRSLKGLQSDLQMSLSVNPAS